MGLTRGTYVIMNDVDCPEGKLVAVRLGRAMLTQLAAILGAGRHAQDAIEIGKDDEGRIGLGHEMSP